MLYINGCSMSWGSGLFNTDSTDPQTLTPEQNTKRQAAIWPTKVGKLLGLETINDAYPGSSNDKIVRETLNYFTKLITDGTLMTDHVAIIQFTCPMRTEIYNDETEHWDKIWPQPDETNPESPRSILQVTYMYHTFRKELNSLFSHVSALGNFFEKHNIKYMFTSMSPVLGQVHKSYEEYNHIKKYLSLYNWSEYDMNLGMFDLEGYEPIDILDNHPNLATHDLFSYKYYNRLTELYPDIN